MDNCENCNKKCYNTFNSVKKANLGQTEFEYSFEKYSHPLAMMLGVTNACNLSCPYCFVQQKNNNISLNTAIKAVQWLKTNYETRGIELGSQKKMTVNFFGGEPLLLFDSIIRPLVEGYEDIVQFGMTTNGTLLTPDIIDFLYKYNIAPLLSFDGVEEVQLKQRPGKHINSFTSIIDNLQYLLLRFPNTIMRATLTKDSIPYMYESVLMAEELGFRKLTFCPNAFEDWRDEESYQLYEQLNKIGLYIYKKLTKSPAESVMQIDPLARRVSRLEAIERKELKFHNNIMRCGLGTTSCAITPFGDIIPCQEKTSCPTTIIGNVWEGINEKKHKAFLENYWVRINHISCHKPCLSRDRLTCLSDTCPARFEDLNDKISTAMCVFNKVGNQIAERLHLLCANSINPYMKNYFSGGTIC